jgi:hypothetical protein
MPKIEPNGLIAPGGPPPVIVDCPVQTPMNSSNNSNNNAGLVGVGVIAPVGPGPGSNNNNNTTNGAAGNGQDMPQKKFPCHLCRRSFMHKQSLDIHMRSHTGEFEFCNPYNSYTL